MSGRGNAEIPEWAVQPSAHTGAADSRLAGRVGPGSMSVDRRAVRHYRSPWLHMILPPTRADHLARTDGLTYRCAVSAISDVLPQPAPRCACRRDQRDPRARPPPTATVSAVRPPRMHGEGRRAACYRGAGGEDLQTMLDLSSASFYLSDRAWRVAESWPARDPMSCWILHLHRPARRAGDGAGCATCWRARRQSVHVIVKRPTARCSWSNAPRGRRNSVRVQAAGDSLSAGARPGPPSTIDVDRSRPAGRRSGGVRVDPSPRSDCGWTRRRHGTVVRGKALLSP